ncbi:S8 family serine peptidase [Oceanobacillus massiliensis]|uniref:S8 family serine peptidase n=1 Tax=Oceanobacillus massiliensis TaxID=1465765 RepID=UPI000677D56E|nr:S8 family serine peptidase [Oceanobacillus massiliensis]
MSNFKLGRVLCIIFSVSVLISFCPRGTYGMDGSQVEAIIGYENELGKQFIIENSNNINHHFNRIAALAVTIDEDVLEEIDDSENISYIDQNAAVALSNNVQNITEISEVEMGEMEQWNIQSIGAPYAWEEGATGNGINIAIIDTGIFPHSDLTISGGFSTVDYTKEWLDDNGHGTHVAGIIGSKRNDTGVVGVAPESNLYAVKALDANGEGTLTDLLEAMEWAIENDMDILNFSLSTEENSLALKDMMDKAYEEGMLIVGASGNDGENVTYPAKYESVIGVSAVDGRLNITGFSSTGDEVEFSAPGLNIVSTYLHDSYGEGSGTSQASPHVTGLLALLKQKHPEMANSDLRAELIKHVQDLGEAGRDSFYGYGFITYVPDDQTAPGTVKNLKQTKSSTDSLSVGWGNPVDADFARVHVYMDDSLITTINGADASVYTLTELAADTEYTITLYTEDKVGNLSEGVSYTAKTAAVQSDPDDESVVVDEKNDADSDELNDGKAAESGKESHNDAASQVSDKAAEEAEQSGQNNAGSTGKHQEVNADLNKKVTAALPKDKDDSIENPSVASGESQSAAKNGEPANDVQSSIGGSPDSAKTEGSSESAERSDSSDIADPSDNNKSYETAAGNQEKAEEKPKDTEEPDQNSEEGNMFTRLFEAIGKLFTTLANWITALFN